MPIPGLGETIGGLGGLASGIGNYVMSEKNLNFQRRQAAHMSDRQDQAWQREDTAVQRRVNDLKKAGLSPVLAAGSSAGSSSPIQIGTPQQTKSAGSIGSDVIKEILSMSQVSQTLAQTLLTKTQDDLLKKNTPNILKTAKEGAGKAVHERRRSGTEATIARKDLYWYNKGLHRNSSSDVSNLTRSLHEGATNESTLKTIDRIMTSGNKKAKSLLDGYFRLGKKIDQKIINLFTGGKKKPHFWKEKLNMKNMYKYRK